LLYLAHGMFTEMINEVLIQNWIYSNFL